MDANLIHSPPSDFLSDFDLHCPPFPPQHSNWPLGRSLGELFRAEALKTYLLTSPICCVLSDRMGVVSSKKQVKEKGKGQWSPVKDSTQSREAPPLPPLVSDRRSHLEREEGEHGAWGAPRAVLLVPSQPRRHYLDNSELPRIGFLRCHPSTYHRLFNSQNAEV